MTVSAVLAALGAIAACAAFVRGETHHRPVRAGPDIGLVITRLPLNAQDPSQTHVGQFVYAGGMEVTSRDTDLLHGLSDLDIGPDGTLTSETDEGGLFQAKLVLDAQGRLTGLADGRFRLLTGLDGQQLQGKVWSDAEGVAVWPNGDLMVSFERNHRIWRYPAAGGPPITLPKPEIPMEANTGMEGLSLAPSQGADAYWVGVETGDIFLCHLATGCQPRAALPHPPQKYRLSSLTETADGRLLVLYDSWGPLSGAQNRVMIVADPASDHPSVLDTLAIGPPLTTDNYEGVATTAGPNGALRLYLIVDDNFSPSERSLLMAFDWTPKAPPPPRTEKTPRP